MGCCHSTERWCDVTGDVLAGEDLAETTLLKSPRTSRTESGHTASCFCTVWRLSLQRHLYQLLAGCTRPWWSSGETLEEDRMDNRQNLIFLAIVLFSRHICTSSVISVQKNTNSPWLVGGSSIYVPSHNTKPRNGGSGPRLAHRNHVCIPNLFHESRTCLRFFFFLLPFFILFKVFSHNHANNRNAPTKIYVKQQQTNSSVILRIDCTLPNMRLGMEKWKT